MFSCNMAAQLLNYLLLFYNTFFSSSFFRIDEFGKVHSIDEKLSIAMCIYEGGKFIKFAECARISPFNFDFDLGEALVTKLMF